MDHRLVIVLLLLLCSSELQAEGNQTSAEPPCQTTKVDIAMLIDGSESISPDDFASVKLFISELVQNFHIDPNSTQIGLTQYSDKPVTEWNLNRYKIKESLLTAINNIQQLGGGTFTGPLCETAKADIVMIVDSSSSIFHDDFKTTQSFIAKIAENFHIHPNKVQIGLTQFSVIPVTEWDLITYKTKQSLLEAVYKIKQILGDTNTGEALAHVLYQNFQPIVGMRADSKKIAVLITDGESTDDVKTSAKNLKDTGIDIYAIGLNYFNDKQLLDIVSGDAGTHLYLMKDYAFLNVILRNLTSSLCRSSTPTDSVRLVSGTNLCSGKLEIKSSQSYKSYEIWSSVCQEELDQQDAEVVCRQLGCGPPLDLQGVHYGEVGDPRWIAEFQCDGTESALLECRRSISAKKTCSPGIAVGLTCSEPVRLVGGVTYCEGTLEVKRTEWRPVKGPDWFLKEAAVVCDQMKCGSAVALQHENSSVDSTWRISSDCVQAGYSLKECASADSSSSILVVTCLDSIRLVKGSSLCSGRLEVKSSKSGQSNEVWSSVCEADFDQQDAEVVCRELGCGPPSVIQSVLYGEVETPKWTAELKCGGNESALQDCRRSSSVRNICPSGKAVRLNCSEPVRLVGGASRCEGSLEVKLGTWGPVDASGWTMQEAAAACRELDCGSVVSMGTKNDSSARRIWRISFSCFKSGYPLRECSSSSLSGPSSILRLICTDLLVQPIISVSSKDGVIHALYQRSAGVFQGSSFTIKCSIQPQYPGGSFQLSFTSSNTTQSYTQPAINHSAHFLFATAESTNRGSYSCVYNVHVFYHNFSSESHLLTLTVSDSTVFFIRLVVLLLSLLIFISLIYWSHKTTRGKQRAPQKNMMEMEEIRMDGGREEQEQ